MSKNTYAQYTSNTPEQTQRIAREITDAFLQQSVCVVGLHGNLGAGKTQFVKGVAHYLGVTQTVNSPTFLIMKKYPTTHPTITTLYHFDCYRITDPQEVSLLGFNDIIQQHTSPCFY